MMDTYLSITMSPWINVIWLIAYIYTALCLQYTGKKIGNKDVWMAWVPLVNIFYMFKLAGMSYWWILLFFVPFANIILMVVLWVKIAEAVKKPSWLGILMLIPFVNWAVMGYIAFSK